MPSSVDTRHRKYPAFGAALAASLLAAGCAVPVHAPAPPVFVPPVLAPAPVPAAAVAAPPPAREPLAPLLEQADRLRGLQGAELGQEIARLGEPGAPAEQLRLAMALGQTRQLYDLVRAQELLQRVLANQGAEARELHPLARLLGARYAEQRRVEDQLDRQGQQLRELQRRLDQTQDKLDALKEIERSLTSRPAPASSAPAAPASSPNGRARPPGS